MLASSSSLSTWARQAEDIRPTPVPMSAHNPISSRWLALALNLLFTPVSLRFEHAAAFELQTATIYTPTKLSSVCVLTTLPDQAKEHGVPLELIHSFFSCIHSQVIQESFAVLKYYHQRPSQ